MAPKPHPTQVRRPWRSVVRTIFQLAIALCLLLPAVYQAATHHDPASATGYAAIALAVAGGVTRVMALPSVEAFLRRFAPWLAADPE